MKSTGHMGEHEDVKAGWVVLVALAAVMFLPVLAGAATEKSSYTHPYCKDGTKPCGGIVYANKGGYVVTWVVLTSRSDQPDAGTPSKDHPDTGARVQALTKSLTPILVLANTMSIPCRPVAPIN